MSLCLSFDVTRQVPRQNKGESRFPVRGRNEGLSRLLWSTTVIDTNE
jgi:hypothetical protein